MSASFKLLLLIVMCGGLVALLFISNRPVVDSGPLPEAVVTTPRSYFEPLIPWTLGGQTVFASVASTTEARTLGLSYTSALPADVVKVFIFDTDEQWSFWMKGMAYPIDMVWVTASGTIAHIETSVTPESYPKSFTPPLPARYVIETVPGLFATVALKVGDTIDMEPIVEKNN